MSAKMVSTEKKAETVPGKFNRLVMALEREPSAGESGRFPAHDPQVTRDPSRQKLTSNGYGLHDGKAPAVDRIVVPPAKLGKVDPTPGKGLWGTPAQHSPREEPAGPRGQDRPHHCGFEVCVSWGEPARTLTCSADRRATGFNASPPGVGRESGCDRREYPEAFLGQSGIRGNGAGAPPANGSRGCPG